MTYFRRWFNKLGPAYTQGAGAVSFNELVGHLGILNINNVSPKVSSSTVNHTADMIGAFQNPIANLPLTKAHRCLQCPFATNGGSKELMRHLNKTKATHGNLKITSTTSVNAFRQCLNGVRVWC